MNTTDKKCCRECVFTGPTTYSAGSCGRQFDCPCHTTDTSWESLFDVKFPAESYREDIELRPKLLAFIQHIAKEEYERGRKEVATNALRLYQERAEETRYEVGMNDVLNYLTLEAALDTQP